MSDRLVIGTPVQKGERLRVGLYLACVVALVIPANVLAASLGADAGRPDANPPAAQVALFGQAVIPAVAALAAWLIGRRRPTWGFRKVAPRLLGAAWVVGLASAGIGAAASWVFGVVPFSAAGLSATWFGLPPALAAVIGAVVGPLPWILLAVGEELGWNSFLTPLLAARLGADRTAVVVGLLWAAFHVPLMLLVTGAVPQGVPVGWTAGMFAVECVALAFPLVWLRLRTGSIWPALVLHGTFNAVLYLVVTPATVPSVTGGWLMGEGGLFTTVGTVAGVLLTRRLWRTAKHELRGHERPAATS